jgi:hypothetical protein
LGWFVIRSALENRWRFLTLKNRSSPRKNSATTSSSPAHPVGGTKAAWFASVGYTCQNWEELRDDLLTIATSCENFIAKPSPYGVNYEMVGEIGTDCRPGSVVAVWIVEENSPPRLVTAYPGDT